MKTNEVFAHCDIPCKIYDPIVIQIAALTVVRIIDIIEEKNLDTSKLEDSSELARLTLEKENQARLCPARAKNRSFWKLSGPRSSTDRAPVSGTGNLGSNPSGGTN